MFGTANIMSVIVEVKNGDIYNPETLQKIDRITKYVINTKGVVPYQILSIAHPAVKSVTAREGALQMRPSLLSRGAEDPGGRRPGAASRSTRTKGVRGVLPRTTTPRRWCTPASGRRRSTSATSTSA